MLTDLTTGRGKRWFRRSSFATLGLTAAINAVAAWRILGYVDRSLLTPLRLWSLTFSAWLVIVLLLTALRMASWHAHRHWFSAAMLASWICYVAFTGALNPDATIARYNLDHLGKDGLISE